MNNQQKVLEFQRAAGRECNPHPTIPAQAEIMIATHNIKEESQELLQELDSILSKQRKMANFTRTDLESLAKEMADVLYVVYGAAVQFGIPLDRVFHEVCNSNMSKLVNGKFQYREDGKVLKGPNYQKPDLSILWEEVDKSWGRAPRS